MIAELDAEFADAVTRVAIDLADVLAIAPDAVACCAPHITLASYTGLGPDQASAALGPVATAAEPFTARAHGYGVITGDANTDPMCVVPPPHLVARHHVDHHRRAPRGPRSPAGHAGSRDGLSRSPTWRRPGRTLGLVGDLRP